MIKEIVVKEAVPAKPAIVKSIAMIVLSSAEKELMDERLAQFDSARRRIRFQKVVAYWIIGILALSIVSWIWYEAITAWMASDAWRYCDRDCAESGKGTMYGVLVIFLTGLIGVGALSVADWCSASAQFMEKLLEEGQAAFLREFLIPKGWDGQMEYEVEVAKKA